MPKEYIYLVGLFYSADLKTVGLNQILQPIVDDIKILETQGIDVNLNSKIINVKGSIVALSHDNLGANVLHGMVESFSAKYFCRICLIEKNDIQTNFVEDKVLLRTNVNYEQYASEAIMENKICFGIKNKSVLNDLQYFKLCESRSVEIHDILEGVAQLEIKLFLKFIIDKKHITLQSINNRIKSYNFGVIHLTEKPSIINLDKPGHLIAQRAVQTWVLVRFLPLIISDVIESPDV